MRDVKELIGKTLVDVEGTGDELIFITDEGQTYKLYHRQDCCESVSIDDINGDLKDLIGSPILVAEEVSNEDFEKQWESEFSDGEWGRETTDGQSYPDSHTWTFYKFATKNGYVDVRWYGESNGYYSESVDFILVGDQEW